MNFVALLGRVATDPEIRYTPEGLCCANYRLAVNRPKTKDAPDVADFFNCAAFGKAGEFVDNYLKKGTKILVSGRLQQDSWMDRNGNQRSAVKIVVMQHEFVEAKKDRDAVPDPKAPGEFMDIPDQADEELPFTF